MANKEGRPQTFKGDRIQRMVTYVRESIKEKIEFAARNQKVKTGRVIERQFEDDIKMPKPDNSTKNTKTDLPPEEEIF